MNFFLKKNTPQLGKKVIFSLPCSNEYQKIENLQVIGSPNKIIEEKIWGNQIVVFYSNRPNCPLGIKFKGILKPIFKKISKTFLLSDYQGKKLTPINNRFINGDNPEIKKIARQLIKGEKRLSEIIKKMYFFTLDYLDYGHPIDGLYPFDQALRQRRTDCGGFATFLGSLIQALGIPTRLVVGFLVKKNIFTRLLSFGQISLGFNHLIIHAWLEVKLPNVEWFPLDPAIEWRRLKDQSKRQGGFGSVPADRLVFSFGCDLTIKFNNKRINFEIIQKPICL